MVTEHALADKKAEDISTLSLIGKTDVADAIVIATGTSSRHVAALANHVMDCLTRAGIPILGVEGLPSADWVVIDAGDMMVHLFQAEARQKYQLEKMWSVTFEPEETNTTTGTLTSAA